MKLELSLFILVLAVASLLSTFHVVPLAREPIQVALWAGFLVYFISRERRGEGRGRAYFILGIVSASVGLVTSAIALVQDLPR